MNISVELSYYDPLVHTREFFQQFTDMNITEFKNLYEDEPYPAVLYLRFEKPMYQQLFDMVSRINEYDENLNAYVYTGKIVTPEYGKEGYRLS